MEIPQPKKFSVNNFWENIIEERRYLGQYYALLRKGFMDVLYACVPGSGNPWNKINQLVMEYRMGKEIGDMVSEANRVLVTFTSMSRKKGLDKDGKQIPVPDSELIEGGLDMAMFKKCLLQISRFMGKIYDKLVPDEVLEFCGNPTDNNRTPKIDISALNKYDLAQNSFSNRFLCAIVVDNSLNMAMSGQMENVKTCFDNLVAEMLRSEDVERSAQLYVVTTGNGPKEVSGFTSIGLQDGLIEGGQFEAFGANRMADTIDAALDAIEAQCRELDSRSIGYWKPWLIILSNGRWLPRKNENMPEVIERLRKLNMNKVKAYVCAMPDISDENFENLKSLTGSADKLTNVAGFFRDVFASMCRNISFSSPGGEQIDIVHKEGIR